MELAIYITCILFKGWYSSWTSDASNPEALNYCAHTPFMYSFVMLILGWVSLPFIFCCLCSAFLAAGTAAMGITCLEEILDD